MAKWEDKTIDKPKEPFKQKLPFVNLYNDYGFDYNNEMYTIPEEIRDFRKKIQNEIIMEELKTQNILGQHITDEIDRNIENTDKRAKEINENIDNTRTSINTNVDNTRTELKQEINKVNSYVVNTVYPKIQTIETKIDTITNKVNENKTLLDKIWSKVDSLRSAVIG